MTKDVFISHAKEDRAFADIVCAALERQGLDCWIAPRDVAPGLVFDEAIIDGIEASQVLVLVLSGSANVSRFVQNEVNRAFSKGKAIVTFRAKDVLPAKSLARALPSQTPLDRWFSAATRRESYPLRSRRACAGRQGSSAVGQDVFSQRVLCLGRLSDARAAYRCGAAFSRNTLADLRHARHLLGEHRTPRRRGPVSMRVQRSQPWRIWKRLEDADSSYLSLHGGSLRQRRRRLEVRGHQKDRVA